MVAVLRPVLSVVAARDYRIEETADRFDDVHQPLDVRVRCVALIRSRLDAIDRQRNHEQRLPAEWIAVGTEDRAAVALDLRGQRVHRAAGTAPGLGGPEAD